MDARPGDPRFRGWLRSASPVAIGVGAVPIAPPYGLTSADALAPAGRIRYDAK
jgi:hypothetical protein